MAKIVVLAFFNKKKKVLLGRAMLGHKNLRNVFHNLSWGIVSDEVCTHYTQWMMWNGCRLKISGYRRQPKP